VDRPTWFVAGLLVLVGVGVVAGWALVRRARGSAVRRRFGAEYTRVVHSTGRRRRAVALLADRARRRGAVEVRPLTPEARERYAEGWRAVQARFLDQPDSAVGDADALLGRLKGERGYPEEDLETRSELISVDHPDLLENIRVAHANHDQNTQRLTSTDDLRRALLLYRSLLDELLVVATPDGPVAAPLSDPGWSHSPIAPTELPPLDGDRPGRRVG
jgi:hypothetical protein